MKNPLKNYLVILLAGLTTLFLATSAVAHNPGPVLAYGGPVLSGGVTIWGNSHGQTGYAGNINLGFGQVYAPAPYYGHVHGPSCGHPAPYGYAPAYRPVYGQGYSHGYGHGKHHGRGHGKGHYNKRHH